MWIYSRMTDQVSGNKKKKPKTNNPPSHITLYFHKLNKKNPAFANQLAWQAAHANINI